MKAVAGPAPPRDLIVAKLSGYAAGCASLLYLGGERFEPVKFYDRRACHAGPPRRRSLPPDAIVQTYNPHIAMRLQRLPGLIDPLV